MLTMNLHLYFIVHINLLIITKAMSYSNKRVFVTGAGGFIGGHLVKKLLDNGNKIVASDIKPKEFWFQDYEGLLNH